jgi:hypothetical protein
MSAGDVPDAVKQFVTCLYGHVRDKNGAFPGETRDDDAMPKRDFCFLGFSRALRSLWLPGDALRRRRERSERVVGRFGRRL